MNLENDEVKNLVFAGLFHDIGKFYQRTSQKNHKNSHSKWSADFVSNTAGYDDLVCDLVLHHHKYNEAENKDLCSIITKADHHSAFEREESENKQNIYKEPLNSIFSRIECKGNAKHCVDLNEDGAKYCVDLKELSLDSLSDSMPIKLSKENEEKEKKKIYGKYNTNLEEKYHKLWKHFEEEFNKINNKYDFDTILYLMKKYTSTIPSAVYTSVPDISLYDHSKTTAAISLVRYRYKEKSNKKLKKTSDKQDVYLLINGDISGIQNFIYKISSPQDAQKGMSKRLRGRSLCITLLCDAMVRYIVDRLDLSSANVLFSAGGRFTILADNTVDIRNKIKNISRLINRYFIDKFNSELYLSLVYISASGNDFKNYGSLNDKLNMLLNVDKKHKFIDNIDDVFTFKKNKKITFNNTCSVCGNLSENKICPKCKNHEKLGQKVANASYLVICNSDKKSDKFDVYIEPLKIGYIFLNDNENKSLINNIEEYSHSFSHVEVSKLNDTDFLSLSSSIDRDNVSFTFSFIGNTVPNTHDGILSFEQLSSLSKGSDKIGVLKMDVDNLGLIFSKGFKKVNNKSIISISRVSTLSSYLDMFFAGFINNIAREFSVYETDDSIGKNEKETLKFTHTCNGNKVIPTIYINYSGGDDLLVIGPYDDVMEFARKLRNEFKKWTCNNNSINISGGIAIVNAKFPIGKAVEIADNNLLKSKKAGKNKITLFNEIVEWEDNKFIGFNSLLNYGKKLEDYVNNGDISKGFIYSLLNMWNNNYPDKLSNINKDEWERDNRERRRHKSYIPYYKYRLRNIKNEDIRRYVDKSGMKYMPWIKIPVSWISLRTR